MNRRAFTLIEVILAIFLVAVLAGGVMGFLWDMMESRDQLARECDRAEGLAVMFERLETDLATTYAADSAGKPGVVGTSNSLTVHGRGVLLPPPGAKRAPADALGCEFSFSPSGVLSGRSLHAGSTEQLADDLERVRFRYFDGVEWAASFDSAARGALPTAIEVCVWFGPRPRPSAAPPSTFEDDPASDDESDPDVPRRPPDRTRIIVVPDAPGTSWKEGA